MAERKGLRTRLRSWWRRVTGKGGTEPDGAPETVDEPDGEDTSPLGQAAQAEVGVELPPVEETLSVAADGDVFAFELVPHFRWSSREMTLDVLRERAALHE
ncbi:hypothetical protein ACWGJW_37850, partial [Streptomyces nigrescens]